MQPRSTLSVDEIRLGDPAFWRRPPEEREGAFLTLRRERPVSFHEQLDPRLPSGPGFWALTRHADVLEAGTTPKVFSSARGIGIVDLPPEFLEFFGSMIAMDAPRHGRLRRLVSAAFTARQLARVESEVQRSGRTRDRRGRREGRVRLRDRDLRAVPDPHHLRDDGHPGEPARLRLRADQHHPRRRRPRVHGGDGGPLDGVLQGGRRARRADEGSRAARGGAIRPRT